MAMRPTAWRCSSRGWTTPTAGGSTISWRAIPPGPRTRKPARNVPVKRYVVGITGASGSMCARSVLRHLARHPDVERIHAVLSQYSLQTMSVELGRTVKDEAEGLRLLLGGETGERVVLHRSSDMAGAISSGSYPTDGMVVVPCSGGAPAAIAHRTAPHPLPRAAQRTLKGRPAPVLSLRATPAGL